MYGKLAALFVIFSYVIVPASFVMLEQISSSVISVFVSIGVLKSSDFPLSGNMPRNVMILSSVISVLSAMLTIALGHYSKQINEDHGVWLNIVIGFGYLYFCIVLLVVLLIKNFSMSGYR